MGQKLPSYPVINSQTQLGIFIAPFTCHSTFDGIDPASNGAGWPGPVTFGHKGSWSPEKHDLRLSISVTMKTPSNIFGSFACSKSEVGLAIEWSSRESGQREISKVKKIKSTDSQVRADFNLHFASGQFRGGVQLTLKLFIVKADPRPKKNEQHLANIPGLCIGQLEKTCTLVFDGTGSLFPIAEYKGTIDEPLWAMVYNSENAAQDPFRQDYICLRINSSHPDYQAYKGTQGEEGITPLGREIIASWLSLFFIILREKENDLFNTLKTKPDACGIETGSIADFAGYFIRHFDVNPESSDKLFSSNKTIVSRSLLK